MGNYGGSLKLDSSGLWDLMFLAVEYEDKELVLYDAVQFSITAKNTVNFSNRLDKSNWAAASDARMQLLD